jgi:hypothetical protein
MRAISRGWRGHGTAWYVSRSISAAGGVLSVAAFAIALVEISNLRALTIGFFLAWSALSLTCALSAWRRTTNLSDMQHPRYAKAITVGIAALLLASLEIVVADLTATVR